MALCPNSMSRLIPRQTMDRGWIAIAGYELPVSCWLKMQRRFRSKNILKNSILDSRHWRIEIPFKIVIR